MVLNQQHRQADVLVDRDKYFLSWAFPVVGAIHELPLPLEMPAMCANVNYDRVHLRLNRHLSKPY
jgi:hypothetical protein